MRTRLALPILALAALDPSRAPASPTHDWSRLHVAGPVRAVRVASVRAADPAVRLRLTMDELAASTVASAEVGALPLPGAGLVAAALAGSSSDATRSALID